MTAFDSAVLAPAQRAALEEAVRRVVGVAHPSRIILFGSAARGEMGPDSDFDLLVIVPGALDRRELARRIHASFLGLGASIDVVVATPEDVARFAGKVGTILMPALQEGRELYAA